MNCKFQSESLLKNDKDLGIDLDLDSSDDDNDSDDSDGERAYTVAIIIDA